MADIDERVLRAVLADLTADQPPAPPNRYGAVRRRASWQRRRQLAGIAAAVALALATAIAVPLGLLHTAPRPAAPGHYRVSISPGRGAPSDLVAAGVLGSHHWKAYVQLQRRYGLCQGATFTTTSSMGWSCSGSTPVPAASTGDPVQNFSGQGTGAQVDFGTVRTDVTYLTVTYNDGQVLTVRPVPVFAARYARWIAIPAPDSAAVRRITAYGKTGELGYTIPFAADPSGLDLVRWLQPGQPPLPRPARYTAGAGTIDGKRWRDYAYVGPWGTCFAHPTGAVNCFASLGWLLPDGTVAGQIGFAAEGNQPYFGYGQALASVSYLVLTKAHGGAIRVAALSAGGRRFFCYAAAPADPVVGWAAYDAAGQRLGSGRLQF